MPPLNTRKDFSAVQYPNGPLIYESYHDIETNELILFAKGLTGGTVEHCLVNNRVVPLAEPPTDYAIVCDVSTIPNLGNVEMKTVVPTVVWNETVVPSLASVVADTGKYELIRARLQTRKPQLCAVTYVSPLQ